MCVFFEKNVFIMVYSDVLCNYCEINNEAMFRYDGTEKRINAKK